MSIFTGDLFLLIDTHIIQFWLYSNASLAIGFSNSDRILFFSRVLTWKEFCPV